MEKAEINVKKLSLDLRAHFLTYLLIRPPKKVVKVIVLFLVKTGNDFVIFKVIRLEFVGENRPEVEPSD